MFNPPLTGSLKVHIKEKMSYDTVLFYIINNNINNNSNNNNAFKVKMLDYLYIYFILQLKVKTWDYTFKNEQSKIKWT